MNIEKSREGFFIMGAETVHLSRPMNYEIEKACFFAYERVDYSINYPGVIFHTLEVSRGCFHV